MNPRVAQLLKRFHRFSAPLLSAVLLGALAACAQLPMRSVTGPLHDVPDDVPPVSTETLSPPFAAEAARLDVFERVWALSAERFYDPKMNGVDWVAMRTLYLPRMSVAASDADVYRVLKGLLSELRDSHTLVLTPREAVDRRRYIATRVGIMLALIEGRIAITEVEPRSPAANAGIKAGDIVTALNGTRLDAQFIRAALTSPATLQADAAAGDMPSALPADARDAERIRVARAIRRVLRQTAAIGKAPPVLRLELERGDGSAAPAAPIALELKPVSTPLPPKVEYRWLAGDIFVLRFTRFEPDLRGEIERALEQASIARGIVIDLRGNGGGLFDQFRWFASHFVPEERTPLRSVRRNLNVDGAASITPVRVGPPPVDSFYNQRAPLLQPLAVLMDSRTASGAELTAITLATERDALLVGEPSCGCVTGVRWEYVLPDGGGVRVSETGFLSARGARLEGQPIVPSVRVIPNLNDLRGGRDAVLEEALRVLRKKAGAPRVGAIDAPGASGQILAHAR